MVYQHFLGVATAPLIGGLFGLAYGTSIRIGYEQIYPALFPEGAPKRESVREAIDDFTKLFDAIGGKEAEMFGLNIGVMKKALAEMNGDAEFVKLVKKNSFLFSPTITEDSHGNQTYKDAEGNIHSISNSPHLGLSELLTQIELEILENKLSERSYEFLDKKCVEAYGEGSLASASGKYCKLAGGEFRPNPIREAAKEAKIEYDKEQERKQKIKEREEQANIIEGTELSRFEEEFAKYIDEEHKKTKAVLDAHPVLTQSSAYKILLQVGGKTKEAISHQAYGRLSKPQRDNLWKNIEKYPRLYQDAKNDWYNFHRLGQNRADNHLIKPYAARKYKERGQFPEPVGF